MGKEFKDIDLVQPTKAAEPAVDFAEEEDVDTLSVDDDDEVVIPQEKLDALRKKYPMRSPAGLEYGRKPQTKEQWDEWEAELEREVANGEFYTPEEFWKLMKEDYPWLYD